MCASMTCWFVSEACLQDFFLTLVYYACARDVNTLTWEDGSPLKLQTLLFNKESYDQVWFILLVKNGIYIVLHCPLQNHMTSFLLIVCGRYREIFLTGCSIIQRCQFAVWQFCMETLEYHLDATLFFSAMVNVTITFISIIMTL